MNVGKEQETDSDRTDNAGQKPLLPVVLLTRIGSYRF